MAKNVIINHVTYNAVPYVQIPQSGGGNAVFYDTSDATGAAANLLSGYSLYGPSGIVEGQLTTPTISQDTTTKVLSIT